MHPEPLAVSARVSTALVPGVRGLKHRARAVCHVCARQRKGLGLQSWTLCCADRQGKQSARRVHAAAASAPTDLVASLNADARKARLDYLESSACEALKAATTSFEGNPVFPCALIAGDVVILHLLHTLGLLDTGSGGGSAGRKVQVVFIDTLHLFPETLAFLDSVEERYGFKALRYTPKDFPNYELYKEVHGVDLPIRDIALYDLTCKVEPFQRALKETECGMMINGRRRDHGAERAHLEYFEVSKAGVPSCQPLAYWEFEDCFAYAEAKGVELHPLHAQGYPSIGDVHSTLPVDRSKWFEYAGERSGRFQGLTNQDGSAKTECGIHSIADPPASSVSDAPSSTIEEAPSSAI